MAASQTPGKWRRVLGIVSGLGLAVQAAAADLKPLDAAPTLFVDVNLITMVEPGVQPGRSVLVRDGRIAAIGAKHELQPEPGVRIVDGRGTACLMPGLADMHLHIPPNPGQHGDPTWRTTALLVASGVTTARGLVGHPEHIAVRQRILDGELLGPTLHIAGPVLHIGAVKSPEDAREKVKQQHEAGFDVIKSHHITVPEIYDAVQQTARQLGIPVSGHVAPEVGLDRALAAGQQIEHLDGFVASLAGDKAAGMKFNQFPPLPIVQAIEDAAVPPLAARVAASGVWNTPTLALFTRVADTARPTAELRAAPEMRYIADQALDAWGAQREGIANSGQFSPELAAAFTSLRNRITRELHAAGAPLLAGSDSPQFFLAPGFALHDELSALVQAGLSPWEALRTATANPARYFAGLPNGGSSVGVAPDFGTVEVGKRADLVLLAADPTEAVDNARQIQGVMLRGKWLDREALDALLQEVAESVGKG